MTSPPPRPAPKVQPIASSVLRLARWQVAALSPAEIEEELKAEWTRREERRARRANGQRSNAVTYRCFNCKLFVRGKFVRCEGCGYEHGGVNHEAESVT